MVIEPSGSTCSATHKLTTGGGVLKSDILEQGEDKSEVYTAAQAFPGTYSLIVKPVLGLSKAADEVARGNYDVTVPAVRGGGEIKHLSERFGEMAVRLA